MTTIGTSAEVIQRIVVPRIGGMASSTAPTLVVIPEIHAVASGIATRRSCLTGATIY